MRIKELITQLEDLQQVYGDIECQLQEVSSTELLVDCEDLFIVAEEYDDGWYVNIRSWPY